MTGAVSMGVAAALGPEAVARIAVAAEGAGLHGLWVNDTPDGDALAALLAASRVTSRLMLATGVLPIDRRGPDEIISALTAVPRERLVVGIGSGGLRAGALDAVTGAVGRLHEAGIDPVYVGALGPRMRRAGAASAEGVLLSWLPAGEAERQRRELRETAPRTRVALYVRTCLDEEAAPRLRAEAARYASYPAYAAHFARVGATAMDTVFTGEAALRAGIGSYRRAVDEVVLRAIVAGDDVAAYCSFAERAAAAAGLR